MTDRIDELEQGIADVTQIIQYIEQMPCTAILKQVVRILDDLVLEFETEINPEDEDEE